MLIFRRFAIIGAVKSLLRDCEQIFRKHRKYRRLIILKNAETREGSEDGTVKFSLGPIPT